MPLLLIHPVVADLFSAAKSLTQNLSSTMELVLMLTLGILALVEVGRGKHGAAIALALAGLIPAMFLIDPNGAAQLYQSTVAKLAH